MTIANLFARLGVDADTDKLKSFDKGIKSVLGLLTAATTAAIGFTIVLKKITDESFKASVELKQFTTETGASAEELQKWQAVAEQTNNSAQSVTNSIKAIVSNQEKIKLGQGGNISGYQMLGIDPTQDPFEILNELRTKTEGLDQGMKKHVLSMMGVSAELLQVLELTNDEFDKMAKSAFIIPQGQIEIMNKAQSSVALLNQGIKWLKSQIAVELAPNIIKLNKELTKWIRNNKEGIVKTIKVIFTWITKFVSSIVNAVRMIDIIIKGTIGWKNALIAVIATIALLNASLITSPIGLLIAGIILLVAALDDLYVYSTGKGESLFGNMMKKFPEFEEQMKGFLDALKDVKKLMIFLFKDDQTGIDEMVTKLGDLGRFLVTVFETLKIILNFVGLTVSTLITALADTFRTVSLLTKAFNKELTFKEAFEKIGDINLESNKKFMDQLKLFGGKAGKSLSNISNTWEVNVDIKTGETNPEKLASEVDKKLQKTIGDASKQRIRNE